MSADELGAILAGAIAETRAGAARLPASAGRGASRDAEAVHDFRVALRRLRTLLRTVRVAYGDKRVRRIETELREQARESGALRDEEVLHETIRALELAPLWKGVAERWLEARRPLERTHRARLSAHVAGVTLGPRALPAIDVTLGALEALIDKRRPRVTADKLARKSLARARRAVALAADVQPTDVRGLHELRIRFKRLRYTAELFAKFYGDSAQPIARSATKMQKRLGEVHDVDAAIAKVARARSLSARARSAIVAALRRRRHREIERTFASLAVELPAVVSTESVEPDGTGG